MRRRVLLSTAVDEPGQCATIGIAGAHAPQCALWCAGQVAAQGGPELADELEENG